MFRSFLFCSLLALASACNNQLPEDITDIIALPENTSLVSYDHSAIQKMQWMAGIWKGQEAGRTLSESQHYPEVENRLKNAIADPALDDFNRLVFWYLYDNMAHWRAPEAETKEERIKIRTEINRQQEPVKAALPPCIVARLDK